MPASALRRSAWFPVSAANAVVEVELNSDVSESHPEARWPFGVFAAQASPADGKASHLLDHADAEVAAGRLTYVLAPSSRKLQDREILGPDVDRPIPFLAEVVFIHQTDPLR